MTSIFEKPHKASVMDILTSVSKSFPWRSNLSCGFCLRTSIISPVSIPGWKTFYNELPSFKSKKKNVIPILNFLFIFLPLDLLLLSLLFFDYLASLFQCVSLIFSFLQ